MADRSSVNGDLGLGFTGALTILFIGLRLGGVIDWSWWWVLSPLWVQFGLALVVLAIAGVIVALKGVDR